jgi:hypothetical protein
MDEKVYLLKEEAKRAIKIGRVSAAYKTALQAVEEKAVFENNHRLSILCDNVAKAVEDGNVDEIYNGRRNMLNDFNSLLKRAKVVKS